MSKKNRMPQPAPAFEFERLYMVRDPAETRRLVQEDSLLAGFLCQAHDVIQRCVPGAHVFLEIVDRREWRLLIAGTGSIGAATEALRDWWRGYLTQELTKIPMQIVCCGPGGIVRGFDAQNLAVCEQGLENFIGGELSLVPAVESVLVSREAEGVLVWSVVSKASDEIRYRIYDRERLIMDLFPDLSFDFHIIDRGERPVEELISGVPAAYQRQ